MEKTISTHQIFRDDFLVLLLSIFYYNALCAVSAVSRLENVENELSKSNQETADILNKYFASVF